MSRMGFGCPASEQKYLPGRDPAGPLRLSPERKCTSRGHYRTSAVTRGFRGATERSPGIGVPGPRFAKGREPPGYTGPFPAAPHFPGPTGTASPLGVQRPCHRALRSHHGAGHVSCVKKPRERQRERWWPQRTGCCGVIRAVLRPRWTPTPTPRVAGGTWIHNGGATWPSSLPARSRSGEPSAHSLRGS